ncbi:AroM family protein [Saccharopolyspora sp. K220]|uniref:AroM family protein n=1 Tax=Saccharopolyspora soli TaxID=2926618 RepID=UPI001F5991BF|nr:AroM family protein [Saccharopolyspora soli]MCI2419954.1 AroM family protein [Saccharopolyspora soli]
MPARLGVVTIGQAPRTDMVPEIRPLLGAVDVVEHGALDLLSASEIADLAPEPGAELLVSRLRDGSAVRLSHARLEPHLRQAVLRAEADGVDATLLVCTGTFADFPRQRPLLPAERLLVHGAQAITGGLRVGVVCPEPDQAAMSVEKWLPHTGTPLVEAATPYRAEPDQPVADAAARLADRGAEIVVLDCMGYSASMRSAAVRAAGIPVVLARSLVARLAAEVAQR